VLGGSVSFITNSSLQLEDCRADSRGTPSAPPIHDNFSRGPPGRLQVVARSRASPITFWPHLLAVCPWGDRLSRLRGLFVGGNFRQDLCLIAQGTSHGTPQGSLFPGHTLQAKAMDPPPKTEQDDGTGKREAAPVGDGNARQTTEPTPTPLTSRGHPRPRAHAKQGRFHRPSTAGPTS